MQRRFYQLLSVFTAVAIATVGWAQQPRDPDPRGQQQIQDQTRQPDRGVDQQQRQQDVTARRIVPDQRDAYRTSQLTGMAVRDADNRRLGTVNDVVVDLEEGKIRYIALSYGGFLGLGDRLFAVPHNAFQVKRDEGVVTTYHLVLDIDEERLKDAPGFDPQQWPNFADPEFTEQIDEFYRGDRVQPDEQRCEPGVDPERPETPEIDPERPDVPEERPEPEVEQPEAPAEEPQPQN